MANKTMLALCIGIVIGFSPYRDSTITKILINITGG